MLTHGTLSASTRPTAPMHGAPLHGAPIPATIGSRPPAAPARQAPEARLSPLMLSDRLLHLAREADGAGLRDAASRLVLLACDVLDAPPGTRLS